MIWQRRGVALVARLQRDEHAAVVDAAAPPPPIAMRDGGDAGIGARRCRRAASCCVIISANEMSCAASEMPVMRPVSCCGKKPLGMIDEQVDR